MKDLRKKNPYFQNRHTIKILGILNQFILFYLLVFVSSAISGTEKEINKEIQSAISLFKQGNFEKARKISEKIIAKENSIPKRILIIAVLTAKDIDRADDYLKSYFKSKKKFDEELSKSVLFFLERAFVLEEYSLGLQWGYLFRKKASSYPEYPKGLYYYSCILKDSGKLKDSLYVTSLALSRSTSQSLDEKIKLLRIHLLSDSQLEKEKKEFLEKFPKSEFQEEVSSFIQQETSSDNVTAMR